MAKRPHHTAWTPPTSEFPRIIRTAHFYLTVISTLDSDLKTINIILLFSLTQSATRAYGVFLNKNIYSFIQSHFTLTRHVYTPHPNQLATHHPLSLSDWFLLQPRHPPPGRTHTLPLSMLTLQRHPAHHIPPGAHQPPLPEPPPPLAWITGRQLTSSRGPWFPGPSALCGSCIRRHSKAIGSARSRGMLD